jgi:hypothetical protein
MTYAGRPGTVRNEASTLTERIEDLGWASHDPKCNTVKSELFQLLSNNILLRIISILHETNHAAYDSDSISSQ